MSFVVNKAENKSIFEANNKNPGPGTYQKLKGSIEDSVEYCAPFNTSQVKVSAFDVPETKYGPGSYNMVYPKDLNKLNEKNQGYVFASRVQRFKTQTDMNAHSQKGNNSTFYSTSPSKKHNFTTKQVYDQKLEEKKEMMNKIRENNNENKVESIKGKREFVRVILTNTQNSENLYSHYVQKNIVGKGIGPGTYVNIDYKGKKEKSGPKWENSKEKRFKSNKSLAPGPGTYLNQENSLQKKQKPSSSFASTQIRSYMSTLIYKTNNPIKAAILQDKRLKNNDPGPGTYNISHWKENKKSFNQKQQTNFTITDRQFGVKQNGLPGPGYYQTRKSESMQGKNEIIKELRNQVFIKPRSKKAENKAHIRVHTDPNLTNGYFQRKNEDKRVKKLCNLDERCCSKLGNMSQAERFLNKEMLKQPGPGQYQENSSILKKGHSAVFHSGTNRNVFHKKEQDTPFYNVIRNDIGYKAEKMKKYIENLRKINILKTPFQTSSKRFHETESLIDIDFQHEESKVKKQAVKFQKNSSSAFKSTTKREVFKNNRKPGPGDYELKMNSKGNYQDLQKKSFNKNYNYCKIEKKRPSTRIDPQKVSFEVV